ncbi:MAG: HD-GYP domain-containing protein [Tumebacillaceae bacterium]
MSKESKVPVAELQTDMVLTRDLINSKGQLVLAEGTSLSTGYITRLRENDILDAWVREREKFSNGLPLQTVKSYETAVKCVEDLFRSATTDTDIDLAQTLQALRELSVACEKQSNFLNLITQLRSYDEYTYQHSIGVGLLSCQIGRWLKLSEEVCMELLLAGSLHDIGKCEVSEAILKKPGRLTAEEYEIVKCHAERGYAMLAKAGVPEHIALAALSHHERMDGTGYPRKLLGAEIDLFGRIVAVADVYNAMTTNRVYRGASSAYKVLDELQQNAFGSLDPLVVSVFVQNMTSFLVGNVVELNDGTVGTVVLLPAHRPARPLLRTEAGFVDLLMRMDLFIQEVKVV